MRIRGFVAIIVTGLLGATGCSAASTQAADGPGEVVERFAAALESIDCAGLFATTNSSARTDLGVTWATVEECEADKEQNTPEGSTTIVDDITEVDETHATAEVVATTSEGVATRITLQLTRAPEQGAWIISGATFAFDSAPSPSPSPEPSAAAAKPDHRRDFLFLAEDFITGLATQNCFALQIMTTREFQEVFAANAGAAEFCDVVENGSTAPWEEMTVLDYTTIDEGAPDKLWGEMRVIYTFDYQGDLWDQELEFGYWHQEGAPGTAGVWKVNSFRSNGSPVPHR